MLERHSARIMGLAFAPEHRRLGKPSSSRRDFAVDPCAAVPARAIVAMVGLRRQARVRDCRTPLNIQRDVPDPRANCGGLAVVDDVAVAERHRQAVHATDLRSIGPEKSSALVPEVMNGILRFVSRVTIGEGKVDRGFPVGYDLDVRPDVIGLAATFLHQHSRRRPCFSVGRRGKDRLPLLSAPERIEAAFVTEVHRMAIGSPRCVRDRDFIVPRRDVLRPGRGPAMQSRLVVTGIKDHQAGIGQGE